VDASATTPKPSGIPPHWDVEVDGIRWLPRMIEKARMRLRGTLGAYLMGHSPVDKALLKRLGIGTEDFVRIVSENPDDAAVLAALRARGFDEASVRGWSASFPQRYATYITLWDLDEGYTRAQLWQAPFISVFHSVERPVMAAFRKVVGAP